MQWQWVVIGAIFLRKKGGSLGHHHRHPPDSFTSLFREVSGNVLLCVHPLLGRSCIPISREVVDIFGTFAFQGICQLNLICFFGSLFFLLKKRRGIQAPPVTKSDQTPKNTIPGGVWMQPYPYESRHWGLGYAGGGPQGAAFAALHEGQAPPAGMTNDQQ